MSFETTVWDLRNDDRLVWTTSTRTTNPSAGRDFVDSLTDAVVPRLAETALASRGGDVALD